MTQSDPVTQWLAELQSGDQESVSKLWAHYFQKLALVARQRISGTMQRVYDEEDAALSALNSFCTGVSAGRFPDLNDRDSLWRLLLIITARKVGSQYRRAQSQKRGPRRGEGSAEISQILSREPSPEFAAAFADQCEALGRQLNDAALVDVLCLKLEGYTNDEIAAKLGCVRRTVQRKLDLIRAVWTSS